MLRTRQAQTRDTEGMNYTISRQSTHLVVTVSGVFDAAAGERCVEDTYQAARDSGLMKVLVDGRGLEANVSIADRHALATYLADLHSIPLRCAVLVPSSLMTTKTLEHTAGNRGMPVRTTDSVIDACIWLGVPVIE